MEWTLTHKQSNTPPFQDTPWYTSSVHFWSSLAYSRPPRPWYHWLADSPLPQRNPAQIISSTTYQSLVSYIMHNWTTICWNIVMNKHKETNWCSSRSSCTHTKLVKGSSQTVIHILLLMRAELLLSNVPLCLQTEYLQTGENVCNENKVD